MIDCAAEICRVDVNKMVKNKLMLKWMCQIDMCVCVCGDVCVCVVMCVCVCVYGVHFCISKEVCQLYSISDVSVKNQMVFISGRCRHLQLGAVAVAPYRSRFHATSAVWLIHLHFWKIPPRSQQDAFQG